MRNKGVVAFAVTLTMLGGASNAGCAWLRRDQATQQPSPTPSQSSRDTASATDTPATRQPPLTEVIGRSRDAGGANVAVSVSLSGVSSTRLSGLLALDTGEGRADYTSASGRTTPRIITGGKTYTSTGAGWIATAQTGRGLTGGDFPSFWSALRGMPLQADLSVARAYSGSIPMRTALALAGFDANAIAALDLSGATASLTLTYDASMVASLISIDGFIPRGNHTLAVAMSISDVGQVVEVTAPTVSITGGPEGQ